jgi:hypothetical protein
MQDEYDRRKISGAPKRCQKCRKVNKQARKFGTEAVRNGTAGDADAQIQRRPKAMRDEKGKIIVDANAEAKPAVSKAVILGAKGARPFLSPPFRDGV